MLITFILLALFSFLLSFSLTALQLSWGTRNQHVQQFIRPEGPTHHQKKAGTPTMGGLAMLVALFIMVFIHFPRWFHLPDVLAVLLVFLSFSVIGSLDDLLKSIRHSNQGLYGWQKLFLQIVSSSLVLAWGSIHIPHTQLVSPWFFSFAIFVIVGCANSVNLTDGLDGLAAGCLGIAFIAFSLLLAPNTALSHLAWIFAFTTLGFLLLNRHPAQIFMGDIGALGMGGSLAAIAIFSQQTFWLMLIGGIFVWEALSVILQVGWYKWRKQRIFRMSPFHHHLELGGLSETQVVYRFWGASALLAGIALLLAYLLS